MALHLNDDPEDGSSHRNLTERARLLPRETKEDFKGGDSSRRTNFFLGIAHVVCCVALVAYLALAWADPADADTREVCHHGGRSFSAPVNYVVIGAGATAGAIAVIAFLTTIFTRALTSAVLFMPSMVALCLVTVEQGLMLSSTLNLYSSCITIVILSGLGVFCHVVYFILTLHARIMKAALFSIDVAPEDCWATVMYTEFGRPAPPGAPRFIHCRMDQNKISVGTKKSLFAKFGQLYLGAMPYPDYPILTDLDGNRTDFSELVDHRRSSIAPTHFQILRDTNTGNIFVRVHPFAATFQTLYGLCDTARFTEHQDYQGADFTHVSDQQFELPPSSSDIRDTLLRPLPRSLESYGQLYMVFSMDAFRRRLNELVAQGTDPRAELYPRTRYVIAFSDPANGDVRATARGEVAIEIVVLEARRLLDSAPHALHLSTRHATPSVVGTPRSMDHGSDELSLEHQLAQANAKIKLLKKRSKEQQQQAQETIERLESMLMQTTQAAASLKEKAAARIATLKKQLEGRSDDSMISRSVDDRLSVAPLDETPRRRTKSDVKNDSPDDRTSLAPSVAASAHYDTTSEASVPAKTPPPVKPRTKSITE